MNLKETFQKYGGINLIKQYARSGSLVTAIGEFILLGKSRTALEILRLSTQLKIKQKLTKKYRNILNDLESAYDSEKVNRHDDVVWICWLQGIGNAPLIVKKCYGSIIQNIKSKKIVLITENNYRDYIKFPDHIQEKVDGEIIKGAHMTDLLRLELLTTYGGTWIDATVYCSSDKIPAYMLNSELFMFQCLKPGRDGHINIISNWFITASSNNKLLYLEKNLLYKYWETHNEIIDYYIFHEFFSIIVDRYPEEWMKVIPFSNSTPHILLLRLFEEYEKGIWDEVLHQSPFHKLTYKFSEDDIKKENTYYKKIMES